MGGGGRIGSGSRDDVNDDFSQRERIYDVQTLLQRTARAENLRKVRGEVILLEEGGKWKNLGIESAREIFA